MATGFDHLMNTTPLPAIGKGRVGAPPEPEPGKVGVKVKAAIFFDGTGNNENNIKKRRKDPSYMATGYDPLGHYDSYKQSYSNVALLHFMHQKKAAGEKIASVYIEGIGTTDDGEDDLQGSGFGAGPTGIVARVDEGITRLTEKVNALLDRKNNEYLEELTVYAFGFSRGAAAARHFCARRAYSQRRRSNLCKSLGVDPAIITLKFVGLFDTVSSFDEDGKDDTSVSSLVWKAVRHKVFDDYSFRNDVPELHLNFDDPTLGKVVQLRAADEYRVNFSVTNIASARSQGKGVELLLPGAHSDIGGGYQRSVAEKLEYKSPAQYKQATFFKEQGWYIPGQLVSSLRDQGQGVPKLRVLAGTRTVPNTYQYVSLAIMLQLIVAANCEIHFGPPTAADERDVKYTVEPGRLAAIQDRLVKFAVATFHAAPAEAVTAPLPALDYHWLRQHYLHLSWKNSPGMEARIDNSKYLAQEELRTKRRLAAMAATPATPAGSADSSTTTSPLPAREEPAVDNSYLPTRLEIAG